MNCLLSSKPERPIHWHHRIGEGARLRSAIGLEQIAAHEHELTTYAMQRLGEIEGMRLMAKLPT
jgi:selenocysteine lyase/cysteine desulfurase